MIDKQIYEKYIEEFIDEVKDYVKGTNGTDGMKYHDWQTMLEIAEQFRVDMLAVISVLNESGGKNG
jgi:poly-D-alanine transfer protein DltD